MDGDLGIVIEPESLPEDLHPFSLVDDQEEGVKGSCMEYKTRCKKKNFPRINTHPIQDPVGEGGLEEHGGG